MATLKAALLGRSLAHSISPFVHREIFPVLSENLSSRFDSIDYENIECEDEAMFLEFVRNAATNGFAGFNVTFPYKYIASELENDRRTLVQTIHSANTIVVGPSRSVHSTDGEGFVHALHRHLPDLRTDDYHLLMIGAGGAARSVFASLRDKNWRNITVAARSLAEAERAFPGFRCIPLEGIRRDDKPYFVVQATPVGQRSKESLLQDFPWSSADLAADLVYNPLVTRFLDIAGSQGATTIDGLGMLIEQAALSQYLWMTGHEANESPLSHSQFVQLHSSLARHVQQLWDDSAT